MTRVAAAGRVPRPGEVDGAGAVHLDHRTGERRETVRERPVEVALEHGGAGVGRQAPQHLHRRGTELAGPCDVAGPQGVPEGLLDGVLREQRQLERRGDRRGDGRLATTGQAGDHHERHTASLPPDSRSQK